MSTGIISERGDIDHWISGENFVHPLLLQNFRVFFGIKKKCDSITRAN